MAGVHHQDGWLKVPYSGPELTVIEIGLPDGSWTAAYRDWADDGTRCVQIRADPAAAAGPVEVRVNGVPHASYPGSGMRAPRPGPGGQRGTGVT